MQFFAPAVALGDALLPAGRLQLAGPLLLAGPLNDDRLLLVPHLDLTNRTAPLFVVTGNGLVYGFRVVSEEATALVLMHGRAAHCIRRKGPFARARPPLNVPHRRSRRPPGPSRPWPRCPLTPRSR